MALDTTYWRIAIHLPSAAYFLFYLQDHIFTSVLILRRRSWYTIQRGRHADFDAAIIMAEGVSGATTMKACTNNGGLKMLLVSFGQQCGYRHGSCGLKHILSTKDNENG